MLTERLAPVTSARLLTPPTQDAGGMPGQPFLSSSYGGSAAMPQVSSPSLSWSLLAGPGACVVAAGAVVIRQRYGGTFWLSRRRARRKGVVLRAWNEETETWDRYTTKKGEKVNWQPDLSSRPVQWLKKELAQSEDMVHPNRPKYGLREREGKWAPPSPEMAEAPEVLVIGVGRQLRRSRALGPRARLGAGAVEALLMRFQVQSFFDIDVGAYIGQCRASLDKSGRAGVQKIHLVQPVAEHDNEVGAALWKTMQREGMEKAQILCALSDWRLPFGQIRLSPHYDDSDARLRTVYDAVGKDRMVTILRIGCGHAAASEPLSEVEAQMLPEVLANAASAMEVWLSEADTGLVMRFLNRPQTYELPAVLKMLEQGDAAASSSEPRTQELQKVMFDKSKSAEDLREDDFLGRSSQRELKVQAENAKKDSLVEVVVNVDEPNVGETPTEALQLYNRGTFRAPPGAEPTFLLFDLNREDATKWPVMRLGLLSPTEAFELLHERRPHSEVGDQPLLVRGERFQNLEEFKERLIERVVSCPAGMHLRLADDEDQVKSLLAYHPDGDRLLDDIVAVKVDCSPFADDTRCYWVVKFDGYEEDISLRTCFRGLEDQIQLVPQASEVKLRRMGPGLWREPLRRTLAFHASELERALPGVVEDTDWSAPWNQPPEWKPHKVSRKIEDIRKLKRKRVRKVERRRALAGYGGQG